MINKIIYNIMIIRKIIFILEYIPSCVPWDESCHFGKRWVVAVLIVPTLFVSLSKSKLATSDVITCSLRFLFYLLQKMDFSEILEPI